MSKTKDGWNRCYDGAYTLNDGFRITARVRRTDVGWLAVTLDRDGNERHVTLAKTAKAARAAVR